MLTSKSCGVFSLRITLDCCRNVSLTFSIIGRTTLSAEGGLGCVGLLGGSQGER